ncbi:hypothetical protein [Acinetobacter radioresistens]|uniref:hypothetical protein n=1 Tax=Acinetobacter radioresistens TaxID=40216 RepID=UPI000619AAA2|nr:hypothetical protein [Acinetobacter radioresistens]
MNAPVNELQILEQNVIVAAFSKAGGTNELFERIAQEVRSHVPDVTTKKGRDAIGSLAMKISKSKTLIEKCGKELVAEQKAQIKVIDDDRISVVKKFDELRNEILAPRDAWEQAEKDRVAKHENAIKEITDFLLPENINVDAEVLASNIRYLEKVPMGTMFEEYEEKIKIAKFETLETLRKALVEREKYEAEQAELERLRQAEILRQQQEREAQIAREAAEKATREAEEKARFEAERVQREKTEAEQREARLKAEKEAAELRAVQAAENERKRIEAEQFAQAEAARKAEEARLADEAHTKKVCAEALEHLALLPGVNEQLAKSILAAIYKGRIPHVSIKF